MDAYQGGNMRNYYKRKFGPRSKFYGRGYGRTGMKWKYRRYKRMSRGRW